MGIKIGGIKIGGKGGNPIDQARKAVQDEIKKAEHEVEKEVNKIKDEALGELQQLRKDAKYEVATIGNNYKGAIHDLGEETIGKIGDEAKQLIEDALTELAKAITSEGLKRFGAAAKSTKSKLDDLNRRRPDLVDAINKVEASLSLGPVKLNFENFYTRADQIAEMADMWSKRPPALKRSEIRTFVNTLLPDKISLGLSINFALLIGSKELGVGAALESIPGALIEELLDEILKSFNVPE